MGAGKMAKSGVKNTLLKQRNRGLILKLIATGQCSSRIEIAENGTCQDDRHLYRE